MRQEERAGYLPHIDGLRAVAIISVLGFHATPSHVPGGFVGVDIFFVISGFLITSILRKQISDRTFSFSDFLARRARRIVPALACVALVSLIAAYFILSPEQMSEFGRSALRVSWRARSSSPTRRLIPALPPRSRRSARLHHCRVRPPAAGRQPHAGVCPGRLDRSDLLFALSLALANFELREIAGFVGAVLGHDAAIAACEFHAGMAFLALRRDALQGTIRPLQVPHRPGARLGHGRPRSDRRCRPIDQGRQRMGVAAR